MIAEKGLVCEERDVSLPQSEHKEPWFMRLNLGEEVPVIIHRDNIISDYDQIIDYVERTFTGGTVAAPLGAGPEAWQAGRKLWGRWQGPVCPERSHRATGKPQMPPRNCIATDPWGPHNPLPPPPLVLRERAWSTQHHPAWSSGITASFSRNSRVPSMATDLWGPLRHKQDPDPVLSPHRQGPDFPGTPGRREAQPPETL